MRNAVNPPRGAGRLIEHPGRNLQPSVRCRARYAAAKYRSVSLLDHLMDVHVVPRPWVPGIENLTHLGPVGVLASCSTTITDRTEPSTASHQTSISKPAEIGSPCRLISTERGHSIDILDDVLQ